MNEYSLAKVQYYDKIEEINNKYKYPECVTHYNRLYVELGMPDSLQVLYDSNELDADYIIENVDVAVNDWLNGTWAKHLSFDEFCEYILPYKVGDEQPTYNWRKDLRKRYFWRAEGIKVSDDQRYSAYWATCAINDAIIRKGCHIHSLFPQSDLEMPLKTLKNMQMGECHDYARYATYVLRACGIPVAIDYTPQWPDRALNHYWNVLFDNSGKPLTFLGGDTNPGTIIKPGQKLAKVYRRTFAYQPQSLFALNRNYNERIPNTLCSPFIKDVSNDYFVGKTIKVKLNDAHIFDKFAYIAVFNNQEWIPVDYSYISEDRYAVFNNLGRDIVYLPVFWGRNGCVPAGNPILLPCLGEPKELIPDKRKMQDIVIGRKFPLFKRIVNFRRAMKNGWFEAANKEDFSDAVKCAEIKGVPSIGLDTLIVSNKNTFRYWRYVSPKSKRCEVAELAFITQKATPNHVRYICSPSSSTDNNAEKAFDGDRLTYYESDSNTNSWVGVDFGIPVIIDKIAYIPRNDDNNVVPGERYVLSFFENGRQRSAGIQTAKDNYLKFSGIPSNCLYILHNLDKGTEERIFIYENGLIKWY